MTVAKTIEISAESANGFDDAVRAGIAKASETVHGIDGAYIKEQKVVVADNAVSSYRVHMMVTFTLD